MKNRAFILGSLLCLCNLGLDIWLYANGMMVLGILLAVGTILVFASGIIWLIYQGDGSLHFKRSWLIVPLAVFGAAMIRSLFKSPVVFVSTPEDLQQVGTLVMSRYQVGLWLASLILLLVFVLSGSLLLRRRA